MATAKKKTQDDNVVELKQDEPRYEVAKFKGRHVKLTRKIVRKIAGSDELKTAMRGMQDEAGRIGTLQAMFREKAEGYASAEDALEKDSEAREILGQLTQAQRTANAAQYNLMQTAVGVALDDDESGAADLLDKLIADLAGLDGPDALDEEEGDVYTEVIRALWRSESFKGFLASFSATRRELGPSLSTLFGSATDGQTDS